MKPILKNWPTGEAKPDGLAAWQSAHGVMDDDPLLPLVARTFDLQARFGQIVGEETQKFIECIRRERQLLETAEEDSSKAILEMVEDGKRTQAERQATCDQIAASLESWRTEMTAASITLTQQARGVERQQAYLLSLDHHLAVSLGPKLATALAARVDEIAKKVDIQKLEASLDYLEEATQWLEEFRPQAERELKSAAAAVNEQIPRLAQLARLIQTMQDENRTLTILLSLVIGGLAGGVITWFVLR